MAFGLRLDGNLPAALATPSGLAVAPDPRAALPPSPSGSAPGTTTLAGHDVGADVASKFTPDTDTRRPDALPYSDPFIPRTAPWKRLVAFDTVAADFSLGVHEPRLQPVPTHDRPRTGDSEEQFYGDLVVSLVANEPMRIPSVGPGARVVHARLGVGADDLDFEILHDSADNWFVRSKSTGRARLVFELTIPRAVFGGPLGDVPEDPRFRRWGSELPLAVQRDASVVAARIGVPKATPRETIDALVEYFRSFEESSEPLPPERSIYLALALSKKGVCRHRAYAFMVTATAVGIRTRVVMNEAHAWVEVFDGHLWKRIDLGGAGAILDESTPTSGPPYAPPPNPFRWPPGARRGEDLARTATTTGGGRGGPGGGPGSGGAGSATAKAAPAGSGSGAGGSSAQAADSRPCRASRSRRWKGARRAGSRSTCTASSSPTARPAPTSPSPSPRATGRRASSLRSASSPPTSTASTQAPCSCRATSRWATMISSRRRRATRGAAPGVSR